ncbi:MAG: divalent-cation tolerance protein CutA [Sphingomicrobium sp.]
MTVVSVYAIFADADQAERIGRQMVEQRLAACVNILGPCRSVYRWHGAVESADEVSAIFKTSAARADALIAGIATLHSYDVPCVTVSPIDKLLGAYADWVEESVAEPPPAK